MNAIASRKIWKLENYVYYTVDTKICVFVAILTFFGARCFRNSSGLYCPTLYSYDIKESAFDQIVLNMIEKKLTFCQNTEQKQGITRHHLLHLFYKEVLVFLTVFPTKTAMLGLIYA